jgi:DNA-3-methyladenine glycosylase I
VRVAVLDRPGFEAGGDDGVPLAQGRAAGVPDLLVGGAGLVKALTPSFADLVWSSAPARHQAPASLADVPATSDDAERLSAELKRAGFTFVGPVSVYAFLQNVGVINDHIRGCFRALGA